MKQPEIIALELPVKNVLLDKEYKESHNDMFRGLVLCIKESEKSSNRRIFPSMISTCTATPSGEFLLVLKDEDVIYNVEV